MIDRFPLTLRACLCLLLLLAAASPASAQVSLTTLGTPYTQNFDGLPVSGSSTWTNNSTIPGWFHARTGTGTTIVANDGSSNAGNLYSFGTGTATDRALGSNGTGNAAIGNMFWGVRLQNNTGTTITSLQVSYTGEQWRNSAAAAQTVDFSYLVGSPTVTGSLAEFQSAGVAVFSLGFTSPITGGTAAALDGNLAANRVTVSVSITGLSVPNGTEIMLRWSDPDHTGADHGLSIDNFSVTPQGGTPPPALNVSDVTQAEGDAPGTSTFTFAVTLSAPAGPGGVTFDLATADGTAQDDNPLPEDNDYVAQSLAGQSIPTGSTGPYNFSVTVNRDATAEPNETFFVNVTNVIGAIAGDAQGLGTITNDDVAIAPIHDIQGPGASSPLVGASVTTRGIVTGRQSNGFFVQEEDASVDADPATSEGIFVLTNGAPPAVAAVGAQVEVTGTVTEFVPATDPLQPPLTRLTFPTVTQLATGRPLPAPIPLTSTFPDPAGPHDQLERLEGMRVSVASLTVTGPTGGNVAEVNATSASDGVFHGVITGVARPFREAGIQAPDPAPSGTIPPIPRWDANPERLRVDSDAIDAQPALNVATGDVVTNLAGPLDYAARGYTILPDGTAGTPVVTAGPSLTTTVSPAAANEVTVASFNLQRFFDAVDDPGIGEPVLTPTAFDTRLDKTSTAIREHLRHPDILGVQEVENLATLQAIADRINSVPGPQYDAYLVEGHDVAGLDVGFLVKSTDAAGGLPRVVVNTVTQELGGESFLNPDSSTDVLWERPPLVLDATISRAPGVTWPVVVIVAHARGAQDVGSLQPGANGWTTEGEHVRARRQKQAESLATYIQSRQTADPAEHLVVLGGFEAPGVNDGFVDVVHVVAGTPPPDDQTAVPGDGLDLVNPDLVNLQDTRPATERYSEVVNGSAQAVDHVLVTGATVAATTGRRIEFARISSDHPETERANDATAFRLSDHDPVVAYLAPGSLLVADVGVDVTDSPDPVARGATLAYTIAVSNDGPDAASDASVSDTLPPGTTFVSLAAPGGWSCSTPAVGADGTVTCTIAAMPVGTAIFTLNVAVSTSIASGTVSNTATVSTTTADTVPGNDSGTATTAVMNVAPTITGIADQTIAEDTSTAALAFTIDDADTPAGSLTLTASSSNTALVPDANIVFGGSGTSRSLTIAPLPDRTGQATITVTVSDGTTSASTAFVVTVTAAARTYFLGEGATGDFFDEDLVIANPNAADVPVTVTFLLESGANVTEARVLPARSGTTIRVDALPGLEAASVSVQVTSASGLPLAVERTQFWDATAYGGHTERAGAGPATRWFFAEGAQGYFDTFVLVANPHAAPVDVTLTFLREREAPVTATVQVAPLARKTIPAALIPGLAHRAFAVIVEAPQPIVAERAMYFGTTPTRWWSGGAAAAGVTAPSATWYFAEAVTGPFFDTFLLLMNPETADAQITVRYLLDSGETIDVAKVVPARTRLSVNIETETDPRLHHGAMSVVITSDRPIVAERSVYWATAEGAQPWGESHTSLGATAAAPRWALAEGRTGGPLNFHTYVLLANPGPQPAGTTVQFLPDSGVPVVRTYVVAPGSRFTIDVTTAAPELQDRSFMTLVTTTGDVPIVVERSMYWDGAGLTWSGGSNAGATPLP